MGRTTSRRGSCSDSEAQASQGGQTSWLARADEDAILLANDSTAMRPGAVYAGPLGSTIHALSADAGTITELVLFE